ncbi:Paromamine 6'-oxidase [Planctomycetes bacterium Poly30]|uniref:Paromamine 6'-oxidase n=1 Tax=Saltatorellus ferox TaxID=2528018 RepID=A0A518F1A9_9BACT|nr:Paromamine 6'-oxidase [Planctomycetes bacterium Poly30]
MIRDLDQHDGDPPAYDVCIIGSGAAGGTVAAELVGSGLSVCVLESGVQRVTRRGDDLKKAHSRGIHVKDYSRERVLGGATTTWSGLSSPLDPADLQPRDFVEYSGWPLERAELLPLYEEAAERYRFPRLAAFTPEGFGALRAKGDLSPAWSVVEEKIFLAADDPQDFGKEVRQVYESDGADLWLDASVAELCGSGRTVTHADVRTRSGRQIALRARVFVVAAGGIENARLLLNSRDMCADGLGNERDQVGRYMMNHPKNYRGILHLARPVEELPYYFGFLSEGFAGYGGLRFPEGELARRGLMNSYVRLEPLFPWSDSEGIEALVLIAKRSKFFVDRMRKKSRTEVVELRDYAETGDDSDLQNQRRSLFGFVPLLFTILFDAPKVTRYLWSRVVSRKRPLIRRARLRNFMEMEPRPENRVTLSDEVDLLGKPLPLVLHDTTALDRRSLVELHAVLVEEFERAGVGRLETDLATAEPWPITQDASHHIGTTRMGTDPATSVVDPDLKLHGADNVHLAGASVFPTSGCANPTFTIVALSIRLARTLRQRYSESV